MPFYNIYAQGFRNDLQRMKPTSNSGWWFKWLMTSGLSAILKGLAAAGVLGLGLKAFFDRISEYDKATYDIVPLGSEAGGEHGWKAVYGRVPMDPAERLVSGMTYKAVRAAAGENPGEWSQVLDFGMGQTPGVNPLISVPFAWAEALRGHNPTDTFRGRPVVPEREWSAGGTSILEPMAKWSLDQSGYSTFFNYDKEADTTLELVGSAMPVWNRLVKVSDYGMREIEKSQDALTKSGTDKEFLKLPKQVQSLEVEHGWLERRGPQRTVAEQDRYMTLHGWYERTYQPTWERIREARADGRNAEADALGRDLERDSAGLKREPGSYVPVGGDEPAGVVNRRASIHEPAY